MLRPLNFFSLLDHIKGQPDGRGYPPGWGLEQTIFGPPFLGPSPIQG